MGEAGYGIDPKVIKRIAQEIKDMREAGVEVAIVMGAGETIMEDVQFDERGQILNPNLHGYLIMTIKDAPEIFSGIVDSYEPRGPYGAKEVGEGGIMPTIPAILNAIYQATGVMIDELPASPERILEGLRKLRGE